jgi:hypothetical protein
VPLCPPQIPHGLNRARTRAAAVGSSYSTVFAESLLWANLEFKQTYNLCRKSVLLNRYSDYVTGWRTGESRVWFPAWTEDCSRLHVVRTGPGVHPSTYPVDPGGKATGPWSWPLNTI